MERLFESTVINGMTLTNRFVRSATWEGLADLDGRPTKELTQLLTGLAVGRVGLIIASHAYVSAEGIAAPGQLGLHSDAQIPSFQEMVRAVHRSGGKICLQISHGGRYALKIPDFGTRIGPSKIEARGEIQCREMTVDEIKAMVHMYGEAARRAKAAGFDAIQIHAAHGYLASEFLSPYFNKRTDAYGGSLDGRARFLLEIIASARASVGSDFPILVKLNAQEFLEVGFTVADMLEVASLLEAARVEAIEMSGGHHIDGVFGEFFPARKAKAPQDEKPYYLDEARLLKQKIRLPLILVGGIRLFETAGRIVTEGIADYISLSRPLIREPGLIARWMSGDTRGSTCISDNGCFKPGLEGKGVRCTVRAD